MEIKIAMSLKLFNLGKVLKKTPVLFI